MTPTADTALELLDYIDRSGGQVWLEGERMRYRLPDGHAATLERLAAARDAVRAVLKSRTAQQQPAVILENPSVESSLNPRIRAPKKELQSVSNQSQTKAILEPLPLELRALVRAAGAGTLPKGTVNLGTGFTVDLERYVLGFAAQYLTGDQAHAILELHACSRAWQVMTRKAVSA